ncbi:TPA: hypothetical protein ACN7KQ_003138 [Klebsiella pneumoniae]
MTQEQLVTVLGNIAESHWKANKQPVLLSNLPPLLLKSHPDYKETLLGKSLKKFIKDTENVDGCKYKLIEHELQRAKVALLPKSATYSFPDSDKKVETSVINDRNSEKALIEFLKCLKKLPEQDQEKIQIPVSVIVKMIK